MMCGFFESNVQLGGEGGESALSECFFDLEDWSFNYKSHLCIVKCTWKPVIIATILGNIYYYCTLHFISVTMNYFFTLFADFKGKYLHMPKN